MHQQTALFPVAILAGGLAKRLRPMSETIPKALMEIRGEPFIAHQLRLLRAAGIDRIVLCVGYLGERIRDTVSDGGAYGLEVAYSFDGEVLLGTAGAIRRALPLLGERFFVLYGDSYLPCNYTAVQSAFAASGRPALMTVFRNEDRWDCSNIEFSAGRILAYDKKTRTPRMRHIDYGLGVFSASAFREHVPAGVASDLATVYQTLLERGELAAYETRQRFYEAGSFQGIQELSEYLAAQSERPQLLS